VFVPLSTGVGRVGTIVAATTTGLYLAAGLRAGGVGSPQASRATTVVQEIPAAIK
jgi:hypothetical protein